jgi:hypothetical protein
MTSSGMAEVLAYSRDALFQACASDHFPLERVATHERAAYLARYLEHQHAATVVVEHGYTDGDYLDDYANYYVRSFTDYSRRCKRLHFFSLRFDEPWLRQQLLNGSSLELQESYLGFVVIRPLPNAMFGRTVLGTYPPTSSRHYPSIRRYTANLFGTDLTLESLAFQEQDTVIAACATVALWSAFQKTAILFGSRMPTPAEITRTATLSMFNSRPLPSRGLTLAQMARATKEVGLEPEVLECGREVPLLSLVYGYLSYGLPVVLGIEIEGHGHHAVTVTGYSLSETPRLAQEDVVVSGGVALNRIGRRIDQLFLHDDGWGPFVKVQTLAESTPGVSGSLIYFEGTWTVPGKSKLAKLKPLWALVPAYHKIRLTYLDIQRWVILMNYVTGHTLADMSISEWEIVLVDNNTLKREVKGWDVPPILLERLLIRPFPKFIWKATLTLHSKPAVELIFDATGIARSFSVLEAVFRDDSVRVAMKPVLESSATQKVLGSPFSKLLLKAVAEVS